MPEARRLAIISPVGLAAVLAACDSAETTTTTVAATSLPDATTGAPAPTQSSATTTVAPTLPTTVTTSPVVPGQSAILEVEAAIPSVFEVELEGARLELVVIEVK